MTEFTGSVKVPWQAGTGTPTITVRPPERIVSFFGGRALLDPGVVSTPWWRPDPTDIGAAPQADAFCGVARKVG